MGGQLRQYVESISPPAILVVGGGVIMSFFLVLDTPWGILLNTWKICGVSESRGENSRGGTGGATPLFAYKTLCHAV